MSDTQAQAPKKDKAENRYKDTLHLPRTAFAMKANLVQNEPASVKRWDGMGLYERVRARAAGKPRFVFHDGPPYANGSIHLGHVLNKTLKDLVVRSRTMMGFDVPYVPGWDCHGLPIEHKVMTGLVETGKFAKLAALPDDVRKTAVRRECQTYAEKYVKLQAGEMERLLTLADYEHPYLTMHPAFEGAVLETLADLVEQGLVFRALKPVHWSVANETALAEAELEYMDREDLSVYVDFEAADAGAVYAAFGIDDDAREERDLGQTPSFMIWTTTPWTLPANLAIAVNPGFEYALVRVDGSVTVLAGELVGQVTKAAKAEAVEVLATARGGALLGLRYKHPFIDEAPRPLHEPGADTSVCYTIVDADYVTLEDGTGLVHTAPGHGAEDFTTGRRVGLPVYCPVLPDGKYDATVPEWLRGVDIWTANDQVAERLRASGHLFYSHRFTHSYPHDWRSKTPVVFRCTEQWFVGVDRPFAHPTDLTWLEHRSLRDRAIDAVGFDRDTPQTPQQEDLARDSFDEEHRLWLENVERQDRGEASTPADPTTIRRLSESRAYRKARRVKFFPEWGRNRMRGMLESRPDWCISRQRSWGLPIPAFFTPDGGCLMTAASVRAMAKLVREQGSDVWFKSGPAELLKYYDPSTDPDCPPSIAASLDRSIATLTKSPDILDVWFESGSTWNGCMRERLGDDGFPIELYLEGSDQHRGWFQSSLLAALGSQGRPPFKAILTHGFMVDKDGKKLSKSAGHTVEDLFKLFGADVVRWWVCSLSYENDMKVDDEFFKLAGESYRKVRNTLRFMLSNLSDFEADRDGEMERRRDEVVTDIPPTSIDAWVLAEFDALERRVVAAYQRYDFRTVQTSVYDFCNDTLSAVYLAAVKDRLYCDAAGSPRRRRTQAALWDLTDGLCRLLAPVLPHTADEAWRELWRCEPGDAERCVHLAEFVSTGSAAGLGVRADERWARVLKLRSNALAALEYEKGHGGPGDPLDAAVTACDPDGAFSGFDLIDLADMLGVSQFSFVSSFSPGQHAQTPSAGILTSDPVGMPIVVKSLAAANVPRCERSWKRDGTVRLRSDGGMLSDRDAQAVGVV